MKNMKRALSLVLALAMVMSMMTMGMTASAKTLSDFSDADKIVNVEEVTITSGLGIFAGTGEGFDPTGTVTRAQMATIIVKMLRGSNFDADNFKGGNKFPDTADFEGGWAEGYINACVQLGVVAGYGDGTFKPDKAVTTAEALTMIINALGVDAGPGQWPMTILAKAEEMKLYGNLKVKPGTDSALTRDQLAVLVYEGLCYSPAGKSGYTVDGVDNLIFSEMADALVAARYDATKINEVTGSDSLAQTVYEMNVAHGFVTDNQASGADYTTIAGELYNVETGLDMMGHYVTVYYSEAYENDDEPGNVYCVVDRCEVFTVEEEIDSSKEYKAVFGKEYDLQVNALGGPNARLFGSDYSDLGYGDIDGYVAGEAALPGQYIVLDGVIVSYIAPIATYASKVMLIDTTAEKQTITLRGVSDPLPNNEEDDDVIEYKGIAAKDYVTYTIVKGLYVLEKVNTVTGTISKATKNEDGVDVITVNGVEYTAFNTNNNTGLNPVVNSAALDFNATYELYVTEDGEYLGFSAVTSSATLTNVVYMLGTLSSKSKAAYGVEVITTKARGVDVKGAEVLVPLSVHYDEDGDGILDAGEDAYGFVNDEAPIVAVGLYTIEEPTDKDMKKENLKLLKPVATYYDEDTSPVYASTYGVSPGGIVYGSGITVDGANGFLHAGSKYIIVDGTLEQNYPLETKIITGTSGPQNMRVTNGITLHMLLSRPEYGSYRNMEVIFVPYALSDAVSELIYVPEKGTEYAAYGSEGYTYEVYNGATGAKTEITMKNEGADLATGFYKMTKDGDGIATLSDKVPMPSSSYENAWNGDGYPRDNFFYDSKMTLFYENKYATCMTASGVKLFDRKTITSTIVVDTRDEETIEADGIGKITSLEQIASMQVTHPDLVVLFDMTYGCYNDQIQTVFITKVFNAGENYMTLFIPKAARHEVTSEITTTLTADTKAYVVRGSHPDYDIGDTFTVPAGTKVTLIDTTNASHALETDNLNVPCFVAWSKDENAETGMALTLLSFSGAHAEADGTVHDHTMGLHNLFASYEDGVLTTINAHSPRVNNVSGTPRCYVGKLCCAPWMQTGGTSLYCYERSIVGVTDDVKVMYNEEEIGMDGLIELYNDGAKNVEISYFCPDGRNTNIIIVHKVSNNTTGNKPYAPKNGELVYINRSMWAGIGLGGLHFVTDALMATGEAAGETVQMYFPAVKMMNSTTGEMLPAGLYLCNVDACGNCVPELVDSETARITSVPGKYTDLTGTISNAAELADMIENGTYAVYGFQYKNTVVVTELTEILEEADSAMLAKMNAETVITDDTGSGIDTLAELTAVVNKTTAYEGKAYVRTVTSGDTITAVTIREIEITDAAAPAIWDSTDGKDNILYAKADLAFSGGQLVAGNYDFFATTGTLAQIGSAYVNSLQYHGVKTLNVVAIEEDDLALAVAEPGGFYVVTDVKITGEVTLRKPAAANVGEAGMKNHFFFHFGRGTSAAIDITASWTIKANEALSGSSAEDKKGIKLNTKWAGHKANDPCYDGGYCTRSGDYTTQLNAHRTGYLMLNVDTLIVNLKTGEAKFVKDYTTGTPAQRLAYVVTNEIMEGSLFEAMVFDYGSGSDPARFVSVLYVLE